ncbi:MAG: sodium:solute symporter, partial [Rubrobacter sp.]|nr:sodium:solute symporter [Rubrobacter sp.]
GLIAGLYCLLYGIAGALIGAAARALVPDLQVADNAFARVATEVLPAGLLGLVLAAALAAVMSTASAGLLASSTILANDVYAGIIAREGRSDLGESRVFTLIVGAAVLAISLAVQDVVGALTVAYNLLTGALFVPIIGALFWRRATGAGALVSMLVSSVVVVALMLWQGLLANSPIYVGMLTSLVVFVVVSLLTRPHTAEQAADWDRGAAGAGRDPRP